MRSGRALQSRSYRSRPVWGHCWLYWPGWSLAGKYWGPCLFLLQVYALLSPHLSPLEADLHSSKVARILPQEVLLLLLLLLPPSTQNWPRLNRDSFWIHFVYIHPHLFYAKNTLLFFPFIKCFSHLLKSWDHLRFPLVVGCSTDTSPDHPSTV